MPPPPWPSGSASAMSTRWIADVLAGVESLQLPVLQALLRASSEPLTGAPEATRERVALRTLQELSSLIPAAGDADAATTPGLLRVDGAQSCEDVLFRLATEVEISGKLEKDLLPPFSHDIQETIRTNKFTLPETSFQLLNGVDPWITSMTPPSQLVNNGCNNDQTLRSSHECVNQEKPVFPTDNAEVQQNTMANLVNESETGSLQQSPNLPRCADAEGPDGGGSSNQSSKVSSHEGPSAHATITPGFDRISNVLPTDASDLGHLPECITAQDTTMIPRPDSREAHLSALQHEKGDKVSQDVEDVSASIRPVEKDHVHGDLTLQSSSALLSVSCNGANQGSKSETNLQSRTATEDRMAFDVQNADKSCLEVTGTNSANQALHDDGSITKYNMVHGGLTVQTAPACQNCNVTLHDKTSEANCFSMQKNEKNRTDVQKDNCRASIPSSSKDRDGESAKKTSNVEKSEDTSPEVCVESKDQDIDDTLEGLSQQHFCIKCGKNGQLLKCSGCPLAAHDSCFGSSVTFERTDLFYCPVCCHQKATEAYEKAKKTYDKARENLTAFHGTAHVSNQHDEQLNGVQPGAANSGGHSNGCDTSKRNSMHQNEAYDLAHQDEEPHQPRKKQKINARGNCYTKEVLAEKVPFQNSGPASMNKHAVLQDNSKTRVEDPERKKQVGDKEARKEAGNDNLSHETIASPKRGCHPPLNQNNEADQEDSLTISNQSGGKRSSPPPWRNVRHIKKRLQGKESDVPSKSRKGIAKQDQQKPTSRRKRSSVHPQKRYSNPVAAIGRRPKLNWTEEEAACLREAMKKFAPEDNGPIPWTRIREYGHHVFHKTRLPEDLRVKWRNMKEKELAGS